MSEEFEQGGMCWLMSSDKWGSSFGGCDWWNPPEWMIVEGVIKILGKNPCIRCWTWKNDYNCDCVICKKRNKKLEEKLK